MLEKTIEIEGLLRIIRDGNPLPETYTLIKRKVAELAKEAESLGKAGTAGNDAKMQADVVIATPAKEAEKSEVVFSDAPGEQPSDELDLTDEDDIILSFDDEEIADSRDQITENGGQMTEEKGQMPEERDQIPEDRGPGKDVKEGEKSRTPRRETKLKSAFSLNDRFLYARELFGGDMKMFDSALDFIDGVDDYAIIEDYFYNEMDWNPENPTVGAFMEVLRGRINNN